MTSGKLRWVKSVCEVRPMVVRSTTIAGGALARSGVGAPEDKSLEGIVGGDKPKGEYAMLAKVPPVAM